MADTSAHGDDLHTAPRSAEDLEHHPGPRAYVGIAIVLAIITALEVAIYYIPSLADFLVAFLLVFSAIKFWLVITWFMHLRFDSRIFRRLFFTGLVLALIVFFIVLATFFFGPEQPGLTG
jgi:cytochrome c oxidase subunit 4